jgi:hypothetical protein
MAVSEGEVEIIIRLKNYPEIKNFIIIQISGTTNFSAYIEGNATIRLDRTAEYKLKATKELNEVVTFSLNTSEYATIISAENNICVIRANSKNKLG